MYQVFINILFPFKLSYDSVQASKFLSLGFFQFVDLGLTLVAKETTSPVLSDLFRKRKKKRMDNNSLSDLSKKIFEFIEYLYEFLINTLLNSCGNRSLKSVICC